MRSYSLLLMLLLLLSLGTTTTALAQVPGKHVMRGRFDPGPAERDLTFVFQVSPAPLAPPKVRWLGATPHDDARALAVQSSGAGRFSAVLAGVPAVGDGRVVVELSEPGTGAFELYSAEFALREHVGDRPASRPSRDGRFVVFTKPEGVSGATRLLIGSGAESLEDIPPGVSDRAVIAVYTLDILPASPAINSWLLTVVVAASDAKPVLHYLAKGSAKWRVLDSRAIDEHSLLAANVAGPGTYLVTREVRP